MVYSIHSCALLGLNPHVVLCEVDLACQLPSFSLVGLPSSLTQESRERIRAAVVNSGFDWPARKVTINLLPANLPKWGSHFELAMALGVLGASSEKPRGLSVLAVGELSLSGAVRPSGWLPAIADWLVRGAQAVRKESGEPLLLIAHESDIRQLCSAAPELAAVCELCPAQSLREAFAHLEEAARRAGSSGPYLSAFFESQTPVPAARDLATLRQVRDEPLATLAALAGIAGGHHCLFAGPHGMGKSMLIRGMCEASVQLSEADLAERTAVLRTFGQTFSDAAESGLSRRMPPVHLQASISRAALEGALLNSGQVLPGELTRAHLGVLVADELLEFKRDVIEAFRQPLDEGLVRLQRAKFRTVLPARFQFLASTNLCPCGHFGGRNCRCARTRRNEYQMKLSGPIMDRFDLMVLVGQRGSIRAVTVPSDLSAMLNELLDSATWEERLRNCSAASPRPALLAGAEHEPADLWSQVSCSSSDRGRLKLMQVAKTLAMLLGETRGSRHLRLAQLIRQDLDALLQPLITRGFGLSAVNKGCKINNLTNI